MQLTIPMNIWEVLEHKVLLKYDIHEVDKQQETLSILKDVIQTLKVAI